jgi:hypothetical protein
VIGRAALALVLAAAAGAGTASRPAASHCNAQEQVIYSCQFGRKTASLCLGTQSLHYRFGPIGKPEIDLANTPDWGNVRTNQLYSNAFAQNHVRISKGAINYLVHFGETGSLSDVPGKRISGVVVLDGPDKVLAELSCKRGARINSGAFQDISRSAPASWEGGEDQGGPFDAYF